MLARGGLQSAMPEPILRLFFALRPPPEAAQRIAAIAAAMPPALQARRLKPSNYHVTLQFLGTHAGGFPPGLVERARNAGDAVRTAPFEVVLDRLDSFRTREPAPLILRPDAAGAAALQALWRCLAKALAANGVAYDTERDYAPHLTIGYGRPLQATTIAPIAWLAADFELIVSHAGQSRHEPLACWPLRA